MSSGKSQNGSRDKALRRIDLLVQKKAWKKARTLLHEELVFQPADHWLWLTLSSAYYEDKEYEKALRCAEWAVQFEPRCPLALWHYAGALYMTDSEPAAMAIWATLLAMDVEDVAHGEHGEGMAWALQLLNDVHYRMGKYYQRIGEFALAAEAYRKHLHNRQHGVGSIYELKQVQRGLEDVAAPSP
jgi:tetratricopeptide (TPR) repeat protein